MHEGGYKPLNNLTSLLALKPRQVLLAEQLRRRPLINKCVPKMVNKQTQQGSDCFTGKPELKSAVQKAILSYLHKNGFSKTLKRFLKEAKMESEDWKTTSVDLEDIYARYAVQYENSDVKIKGSVKEDSDKNIVKHKDTCKLIRAGSVSEQNDKSNKEGNSISQAVDNNGKVKEILLVVSEKKLASSIAANGHDEITDGAEAKGKKDKKKRQTVADCTDVSQGDGKAESKGKKKKKVTVSYESEFGDNVKSLESGDTKVSKKRKSAASSDGEEQPVEDLVDGESKSRKIEKVRDHHNEKIDKEVTMINGDKLKNGVQHSSEPKSPRKERNVSIEPRSANAFQRVKVEEVKFVDDRLQNNSYWAKDGAEYGYGAKAQEVLGRVKGKDFQHEKTKKKRGSYRGGQIDFQAHSVKFNYSDEE